MADTSTPPPFVRLVADPLRWRLLHELARSDLRVRELVDAVGQPQNLVSYHLDLTRWTRQWADAADALHPGLRLPAPPPPDRARGRVLFLCTGNSGRSPMAAALLRHRSAGTVAAASAGSRPKPLHPNAVRIMAEYGIALRHEPTHVDTLLHNRFTWVISLCDRVREVCPEFPNHPTVTHWSLPDPAAGGDTDDATLPAYRDTAAELDRRIGFLLLRLAR
ncbi:MAG TPA: ArsR family transcriptional regulator [Pseudonocardiaceae bacterium]|nr:ArsR family transcriptional regulator [Pseudonocardiaceae bacterium]